MVPVYTGSPELVLFLFLLALVLVLPPLVVSTGVGTSVGTSVCTSVGTVVARVKAFLALATWPVASKRRGLKVERRQLKGGEAHSVESPHFLLLAPLLDIYMHFNPVPAQISP